MDATEPLEAAAAAGLRPGAEFVSDWLAVDQARIDAFAEATLDRQFIHVDPVRARAETPFGGTIAHGFLTLALISPLAGAAIPRVPGTRLGLNYGFDRIRFVAPVPAGARIRGRFRLEALEAPEPGELRFRWAATVEIEGAARPALAAVWLTRLRLGAGPG